jgi:hypothetical protein
MYIIVVVALILKPLGFVLERKDRRSTKFESSAYLEALESRAVSP